MIAIHCLGSRNGGVSSSLSYRIDENGSEELTRGIINHILNGAIGRAIDELQAHYPAVLDLSIDNGEATRSSATNGRSNGNGTMNGNGN